MNEESKSYQKMLGEVESIIQEISTPELDLDVVVSRVEKGYELIQAMRARLDQTRGKIEELHRKFDELTPSSAEV